MVDVKRMSEYDISEIELQYSNDNVVLALVTKLRHARYDIADRDTEITELTEKLDETEGYVNA